jgi:hypothetical protein
MNGCERIGCAVEVGNLARMQRLSKSVVLASSALPLRSISNACMSTYSGKKVSVKAASRWKQDREVKRKSNENQPKFTEKQKQEYITKRKENAFKETETKVPRRSLYEEHVELEAAWGTLRKRRVMSDPGRFKSTVTPQHRKEKIHSMDSPKGVFLHCYFIFLYHHTSSPASGRMP